MDYVTLSSIVGCATATCGFIYTVFRNFKLDTEKKFEGIDKRFDSFKIEIDKRFESIDKKLEDLSKEQKKQGESLFRLEGAFYERGYWQSRRTGTEKTDT